MKKLIPVLIFICSLSPCFANWHDTWVNAVEACHEKDYVKAESSFTEAIAGMEAECDKTHPHAYVDRARLYLLKERYSEALVDLDKAMSNPHLKGKDKLRAVVSRLSAAGNLGLEERVHADFVVFDELTKNETPDVEFTENAIVIRNSPDCECYRETMSKFFLHAGMVDSLDDIKTLNSGVIIAKRSPKKACDSYKCGIDDPIANEKECKEWCAKGEIFGNLWCCRTFKRLDCQMACILVVRYLVKCCNWCCEGEKGFYERCIDPFDHLIEYMFRVPCDPYWD